MSSPDFQIVADISRISVQEMNPNDASLAKFTKALRIINREHMNRPLGEYQKNMIDGVLKKYGKYTVKRPIDKQTIRCLNSLVKRGLVTFDAETETYRLEPNLTGIRRA